MVRAMAITTMVLLLLLLLLLLLKRTVTLMLFLHFLDDRWLRNDDGRTVDFAVVDVVAVVEENIVWRRHRGYNVGFCFVPSVFFSLENKKGFRISARLGQMSKRKAKRRKRKYRHNNKKTRERERERERDYAKICNNSQNNNNCIIIIIIIIGIGIGIQRSSALLF